MSRLMPRNTDFGRLFTRSAEVAVRAAQALVELLADYRDVEARVLHIRELEHEGDRLSAELTQQLSQSFIVPFDREDIIALGDSLDDLIDDIEEAARKLHLYRIERPISQAGQLAAIVRAQAELLVRGLPLLEKGGRAAELAELMKQVRQLEDQGDTIGDEVQQQQYDGVTDIPGMVQAMRMGEVVALLEEATDQAQRVAKTVEGILLKNA